MTAKRKSKFSIVTNKMSAEVYTHLDAKLNNRDLTAYIIDLVEKDLNGEFGNADYDSIMNEIQALREDMDKIERIEVKYEDETRDTEKSSLVEKDFSNEVTGRIDEDFDIDL